MSARNSLENKRKRREHNEAHKAVPAYHEIPEDRNKYSPVNLNTFQVAVETDLTEEPETCILTAENIGAEDDCTTHDHE